MKGERCSWIHKGHAGPSNVIFLTRQGAQKSVQAKINFEGFS